MSFYEHVFIMRQDLSNTQAEALIEEFSSILSENGGTVVEHEYWGVKTMAYKVNKNRKGHYAFLKTDAPAVAVKEMERLMALHEDVMRLLTIRVDGHDHRDHHGRHVFAFEQMGLLHGRPRGLSTNA